MGRMLRRTPARVTLALAALVAVVAIALAFLPSILLRDFVADSLTKHGLEARGLDSVSVNLYGLSLETGPVRVVGPDGRGVAVAKIGLHLHLMPLASRHVDVDGIEISGLDLTLDRDSDGRIRVAGLPPLRGSGKEAESDWLMGLTSLVLSDSRVHLNLPAVTGTLDIKRLALGNFKTWTPDHPGTIGLDAAFEGGRITLDGQATPLASDVETVVKLEFADLPLQHLHAGPALSGSAGGEIVANLAVKPDEGAKGKFEGTLRLANVTADIPGAPPIGAGEVAVTDISGDLDSTSDKPFPLDARGTLNIDTLRVGDVSSPLLLISAITTPQWTVADDGAIHLDDLHAATVRMGPAKDHDVLHIAKVDAQTIEGPIDGSRLSIGTLALTDLKGALVRTKTGIVLLPGSTGPKKATNAKPGPMPAVSIGTLRITGDSGISFTEKSLKQPANFNVAFETFKIAGLDSGTPAKPAALTVKAKINEFADLDLSGTMSPFNPAGATFRITGKLTGMDLVRLTPYSAAYLGVNLDSGQLNAKLTARATDGLLDSLVDLDLRSLKLSPLETYEKTSVVKRIDIPIETALSLLRDGNGNIKLKVPIKGPLNDPAFDMSDAVSKAIAGAVQGAVTTTLKVLFPFAGLASLVIDHAGAKTLGLKPIAFPAGETAPAPGELSFINRLGDLLTAKPTLNVLLCGHAVATDLAALRAKAPIPAQPQAQEQAQEQGPPPVTAGERAQLIEMAAERTRVVKRFLIAGHNIAPERLLECRPVFDEADGGDPRVEPQL